MSLDFEKLHSPELTVTGRVRSTLNVTKTFNFFSQIKLGPCSGLVPSFRRLPKAVSSSNSSCPSTSRESGPFPVLSEPEEQSSHLCL